MSEANNLVPATNEELNAQDAMLASLTDIAYSSVPENKPVIVRERHRSRFFFKLSKSFAETAKVGQKTFKAKDLTHVDHEVEKRLKDYRKEVPAELASNIDEVREFFLREIAPISLAANAGANQAMEVVKRMLGSDIDGTQFEKFERMAALAVDIKMARFIARQFGMTKVEANEILEKMKPRQPTLIPVGVPNERPAKQKDT